MFYVSRILARGKYGVVDTEDGRESVMTTQEIKEAVFKFGAEIRGVDYYMPRGSDKYKLKSISVWQPPNQYTQQQIKARVLKGVKVQKAGDEVTGISVKAMNGEHLTIKLSDFGTKWGAYVLKNQKIEGDVTFVLDDSLQISNRTFKNWYGKVKMDFRAVTKMSIVDTVLYDDIFEKDVAIGTRDRLTASIIDRPERQGYPLALFVLCGMFITPPQISVGMQISRAMTPEVKALVDNRICRKFKSLAKSRVMLSPDVFHSDLEMEKRKVALMRGEGLTADVDFKMCVNIVERYEFLDGLKFVIASGFGTVYKWYNYVRFFPVTEEIQKAFIVYCNKVMAAIDAGSGVDCYT